MSEFSRGRLSSDELVLWKGRPEQLPKLSRVALVLIGFLFVAFGLPIPLNVGTMPEAGLPIPTFLLILNLYVLYVLRGTRYYVTSRRILAKRPLLFLKREEALPLSALMDVRAKRLLGTRMVEFRTSGKKKLMFRALNDDPEKVRRIVIEARNSNRSAERGAVP